MGHNGFIMSTTSVVQVVIGGFHLKREILEDVQPLVNELNQYPNTLKYSKLMARGAIVL